MHDIERSAVAKLYWRILPLTLACYIIAYLDRSNVGFAALQMNAALHLTPSMYAFGGGIFFIGYLLFEVPSNWMLERVGPRRWIARIMITWGLVSGATAFVTSANMFYIARFALGVAEAGFLPAMILYMTRWFPAPQRNRVMGVLILGVPLSFVLGAPISGFLISLPGGMGLASWQWLFIIEAIPAVLLGIGCFKWLADHPSKVQWLTIEERDWLARTLEEEAAARRSQEVQASFGKALLNGRVWVAGLAYIGVNFGMYGVALWLPQIIKAFGVSNSTVGWLTAIPYAISAVVMVLWTRYADRSADKRWHAVLPCMWGALGLLASALTTNPILAMVSFAVAASGVITSMPTLWAAVTLFLGGPAAAGGIAMVNSIGQLGGFGGPYLVGYVRETTNSFAAGMSALAGCLLLAAVILYLLASHQHRLAGNAAHGAAAGMASR